MRNSKEKRRIINLIYLEKRIKARISNARYTCKKCAGEILPGSVFQYRDFNRQYCLDCVLAVAGITDTHTSPPSP